MKPVSTQLRQNPWAVRSELLPAIAAALARLELGESDLLALEEPAAGDPQAATRMVETTGGVAVLPLRGLITPRGSFLSRLFGGAGGLAGFRASFREALKSDDVGSILIDVDSPGGSVALLTEVAAEIRGARGTKPITAVANTTAASAAYWLAAQADELVVTPSGRIGSIGVFSTHVDESKWLAEMGLDYTLISAGRYKTEGNPYEPLSDEARAAIQQTVDTFYGLFVRDVAAGRKTSEDAVRGGYGEGRIVEAERAVALGMADRVETYEATVARLAGREPTSTSPPTTTAIDPAEIRGLQLAQPRRI